ncbi:MAG TPA: autotransporter domain-containing protein, partial [Pontiella sp.]|nr:autotransporter domain-containing protein [Pontiella sp.]
AILPVQGQTNVVGGKAYGTNYVDLATTNAITSIADGFGTLLVGFSNTTSLALNHDITGFVVIDNQAADFSVIATTNAAVTSSGGSALVVINSTNLNLTGGRFTGTTDTGGVAVTAVGGLLRNSTATINGSEFTGAAGNAGLIVQSSDLTVTDGIFVGGKGAAGLSAVSNSTITINSGRFNGAAGIVAQASDLVVNDGSFFGEAGGYGLLAISKSVVTINSGTFTGGLNAVALYTRGSDLTINDGTYNGGNGAEALYAEDSDVMIEGGTFTGGNNAAALYARNSDLTINGGTFQGGSFEADSYFGLVSIADAGQTNFIMLDGGTFNSIDFAGSGVQTLTAGTGLQVNGDVVLDGGLLIADNASSSAFQSLWIRSGQIRFENNYSLFSEGSLKFVLSAANSTPPFSADSATFETNSSIDVDASLAIFNAGTNDVVLVSTESGISVIDAGGSTNSATDANLAENVNITSTTTGRNILSAVLIDGGTNMVFRFTTEPLKDYWNTTGTFGIFAEELDSLITPEMNGIINLIDNPVLSSSAVEQTYFTTFNSFQTALQGIRTAVGQSVARGTELRDQKRMVPRGARGPGRRRGRAYNQQIRGWGKYFGNYYTRSESGLYPSYDTGMHGGVLGVDTSIGNLIIGISGGASRYRTEFDGDATEDTTAAHGGLYGTYGGERGYIDAGLAYGYNQVETQTADPFRLDGDFDAQAANIYLGGGFDLIDTRGGTVFTPEFSIQYAKYKQDSYTEKGTAAVPRKFDDYDEDSLQSSLGINISMEERRAMKTVAFQLDGRLHWMHEFNADPSNINFKLAGGTN